MLVNYNNNETEHIKFINYDGKSPCLCTGRLTLKIDGEEHTFGYGEGCEFHSFWMSGGSCNGCEGVSHGEWEIDVNDIPEQFQKYAKEIDEVFNENVEYGCCGGCI